MRMKKIRMLKSLILFSLLVSLVADDERPSFCVPVKMSEKAVSYCRKGERYIDFVFASTQ